MTLSSIHQFHFSFGQKFFGKEAISVSRSDLVFVFHKLPISYDHISSKNRFSLFSLKKKFKTNIYFVEYHVLS